jgi:NAD(P)-dependent dehydrogenase (short-subunit alcohol dehydrogenase family)
MNQEPEMMTTGQVALVTGASSGIGHAGARALVEAGFDVIGTSRSTEHVTARDGVTFLELDVADEASVAAAVGHVIGRFGRLDVLVDNAGIGSAGAAEESSVTQAQGLFDRHQRIRRHAYDERRAAAHAREGERTDHQSVLDRRVHPAALHGGLRASKHAIEGYSVSIDHELREYGVRVLLGEPAWTSTASGANSVPSDRPLPVYARQRHAFEEYMAGAAKDADDPAVVAKEIVAGATDSKPKLRFAAGARTARVHAMRRIVPSRLFDRQLRKLNRLPA